MLVLKYSEPTLKARHARARMEAVLVSNVKSALASAGEKGARVSKESGVLFAEAEGGERLLPVLRRVFGVDKAFSAREVPLREEEIFSECVKSAAGFPEGASFAVRVRRAWKHLRPSQELAAACGSAIFLGHPEKKLRVDLSSPGREVFVELRKEVALVSSGSLDGPGGLPAGCEGKAVCIIDSKRNPILAAWMMAKRGMLPVLLLPTRFKGAKSEAEKLAEWFPGMKLETHETAASGRRELLLSACSLAGETGAAAIVTGDLFGDVSKNGELRALDEGLPLPVFRPLVGFGGEMLEAYLERAGF